MQQPILKVDKGEEIARMLISSYIPGTGFYKFLCKQKRDKTYEWAHFVERDNGSKEKLYRGEVATEAELNIVIEIMNRTLKNIFGTAAEMKEGKPEVKTIWNNNTDKTIN